MLNDADPAFRQAVTTAGLATRDGTDADLTEPRGKFRGQAAFVALPRSTDEVARLVRLAAEARVGLVPYGMG